MEYVLEGASFFEGWGRSSSDTLLLEAPVPTQTRVGGDGSVFVLTEGHGLGEEWAIGSRDPVPVVRLESSGEDLLGPRIQLRFSGSSTTVVPGDTLIATLSDPSGINVLGTSPASRVSLDFDDSGFRLDLTPLYRVEENRFDQGQLRYALPGDLTPGRHTVEMSAADTRGNVSSASLAFELRAEGELSLSQVLVVPNPVSRDARFVLDLSAPATVTIQIHSLDGRRIRRLEAVQARRGTLVIPWDGLDFRGDELANGAYLFTARAAFHQAGGLSLTSPGRLVKMR